MFDTSPAVSAGSSLFARCLPFSLHVEAGYQADPSDAGNWSGGKPGAGTLIGTNHGISAPVLARWRDQDVTAADMRALTTAEATAIYAANYWNKIRGDDLGAGIGLSTFDMQINAGSYGAICLQRATGLAGADVDGWIGQDTLTAIAGFDPIPTARHLSAEAARVVQSALGMSADGKVGEGTLKALQAHPQARAIVICAASHDQQVAHYRQCALFAKDGRGWLARALARLQAALTQLKDQTS